MTQLKTRDGLEIIHIFPNENKIIVDHEDYPLTLNKDTPDVTARNAECSDCFTVIYVAINGRVFVQPGVLFYEMNEAFIELSLQAYEAGTSVDYIAVK